MSEDSKKRSPFGWDGIVTDHTPLRVGDKLDEAKFFLDLMRREPELDRFRWLTSACLGACSAALDWLGTNAHFAYFDEDGEEIPDKHALDVLSKYMTVTKGNWLVRVVPIEPTLVEMRKLRNRTAHRNWLWIDKHPHRGDNEAPGNKFVFVDQLPGGLLKCRPGKPVCEFCSEVVHLIVSISDETESPP